MKHKLSKEDKAKAKLAKALGLDAPEVKSSLEKHDVSMEGEATLAYYENPKSFSHKSCKECGDSFATRGSPVAYCSDRCRIAAFESRMGVTWKPGRSIQDRYGRLAEPLTVSPEGLAVAQAVMAEEDARLEAATEPGVIEYFEGTPGTALVSDEWPGYGETASELDADTLDILKDLGLD